jgi:hypothetical protein
MFGLKNTSIISIKADVHAYKYMYTYIFTQNVGI